MMHKHRGEAGGSRNKREPGTGEGLVAVDLIPLFKALAGDDEALEKEDFLNIVDSRIGLALKRGYDADRFIKELNDDAEYIAVVDFKLFEQLIRERFKIINKEK
jgi:hypothetical protein